MKKIALPLIALSAIFTAIPLSAQSYDDHYSSYVELPPETSGERQATAEALEDDVYDLMNVNTWERLSVENLFVFTGINSTTQSTFAAGKKIRGDDLASVSWTGNLWSDKDVAEGDAAGRKNDFSGMYGWGKFALRLALFNQSADTYNYTYDDTNTFNLTDFEQTRFAALFGYNHTEKLSFNVGGGYHSLSADHSVTITELSGVTRTIKYKLKAPSVTAAVIYALIQSEKQEAKISATYDGVFQTYDYGDDTIKKTTNTLTAEAKVKWQPVDRLTYGLDVIMPLSFVTVKDDGSTSTVTWGMTIRNGCTIDVKPDFFLLHLGMETTIPDIISDDGDRKYGEHENKYYAGFSLFLIPKLRLDACADFSANARAVSMENIWQKGFTLSLRGDF